MVTKRLWISTSAHSLATVFHGASDVASLAAVPAILDQSVHSLRVSGRRSLGLQLCYAIPERILRRKDERGSDPGVETE